MKSLKIALIASFVLVSIPSFGMFLDPVLKENNSTLLLNSNLSQKKTSTLLEFSPEKSKKPIIVPEKCSICKEHMPLKQDRVKIKPCNHIVHSNCFIDWVLNDWTLAPKNKSKQCPDCEKHFEIKNMKLSTDDKDKALAKTTPTSGEYQLDETETLAKKSAITMLAVFALFNAQSRLPWYLNRITAIPVDFIDSRYGLTPVPFTTSSQFRIKYFGKLLYLAISEIIPTYLIKKELKKKIFDYFIDAYWSRDLGNTLPTI